MTPWTGLFCGRTSRNSRSPPFLLSAIKASYGDDCYILGDDCYILVDGRKRSDPVHPTRGVKQGCLPLINDFSLPQSMRGHASPTSSMRMTWCSCQPARQS